MTKKVLDILECSVHNKVTVSTIHKCLTGDSSYTSGYTAHFGQRFPRKRDLQEEVECLFM